MIYIFWVKKSELQDIDSIVRQPHNSRKNQKCKRWTQYSHLLPVYISQVRVYISILTFFSESQSLSHNSAFIFHHKIKNKNGNCFFFLFFLSLQSFDFSCQDYELTSYLQVNCKSEMPEKKSLNCKIKSHNYFFITWEKASFHNMCIYMLLLLLFISFSNVKPQP